MYNYTNIQPQAAQLKPNLALCCQISMSGTKLAHFF